MSRPLNEELPSRQQILAGFKGYDQASVAQIDEELAFTGPQTPGGEYMRRYWHPVYLSDDLSELPKAIKILGEELVLFRYGPDKTAALVHKFCPHRRASLEYGRCEDRGIRCCYHGWLFAPDGEILETPGESPDAKAAEDVRRNTRLGAYPVVEFRGLIFAYMGPVDEMPEFPVYDTYLIDDLVMRPYKAPYECNWIQVLDAIMDPVHTSFLHSTNSHPQFSEGMGELGELEFYERHKTQFLGSSTRRVGDNVWVRINELILPNFTQAGSAFAADGTQEKLFGRSAFTRWVVPVDDETSIVYAWGNFGERGDPHEYNTQEGCELIEQGEVLDRTPEEKQRRPADSEAVEGMGRISTHRGEHLMATDRGVSLYRRRIRREIRNLEKGQAPRQPVSPDGASVRTYGQDTVLSAPMKDAATDRKHLHDIGLQVMAVQFDAEEENDERRDDVIFQKLDELKSNLS